MVTQVSPGNQHDSESPSRTDSPLDADSLLCLGPWWVGPPLPYHSDPMTALYIVSLTPPPRPRHSQQITPIADF